MIATDEEITQIVDEFVGAVKEVGLSNVMPAREQGPILHLGPVVRLGRRAILSRRVLLSMAKKICDTFLEQHPDSVNSFFHAINYEMCMNRSWDYESATLNRELWDTEAKLSKWAAEAAMRIRGKNYNVEGKLWDQFMWAVPDHEDLTAYKSYYLESSDVKRDIQAGIAWGKIYQKRQDFSANHVFVCRDYRQECRSRYPQFKQAFDQETQLLMVEQKPQNSDNPLDTSRLILKDDPQKACYILDEITDYIAQIDGREFDLLDHIIPVIFARAEYLAQRGGEFIYNAVDYFHSGEYYQSHRFVDDELREDVLLYSQQQVVRIGEENADLDIENIKQQTAILKQQLA